MRFIALNWLVQELSVLLHSVCRIWWYLVFHEKNTTRCVTKPFHKFTFIYFSINGKYTVCDNLILILYDKVVQYANLTNERNAGIERISILFFSRIKSFLNVRKT